MKRNFWNILTVVLFALLLLAMPVAFLLQPYRAFSDAERRYLAEPPQLSEQKLSDWSFDDKVETFLADHMPARDAFVSINAYLTLYAGRQVSAEVYRDADGYLIEAPVAFDETELDARLRRIAKLGEATGLVPRLLIVPSTGYIRSERLPKSLAALYGDGAVLKRIADTRGVSLVPIAERFRAEGQAWYYRTDHHWTADGAFAAYEAYMRAAGREPLPREAFTRRTFEGYSGSTRSRSALWLTAPDVLTVEEPKNCRVTVTFSDDDAAYDGMFFYGHLEEYDWYPLFLDGNHPVTVIENADAPQDAPVLVMVKDSFGNTLAPLLAPSYRTVVLADLRYSKQSVADLCAQYGADELLFCYSIERIATDLGLKTLK
ncbi:MAG: hypothetical protein IJJ86_04335 [Clostridia bacterium]|nr:hypothetical protein [Clostridia bacterium]